MLADDREHRQRGVDSGCVWWGRSALPAELSVASAMFKFQVPAGLAAADHCFDVGVERMQDSITEMDTLFV